MAQYEKFETQDNAAREGNAPRRGAYPLIVVLVAAAFAANAWFFYHQGQHDAVNLGTESTSVMTPATPSEGTASPAATPQPAADNAAATSADSAQPPATSETNKPAATDGAASADGAATDSAQTSAANETANRVAGAPDIVVVVRPKPQAKAKAANQRLMAKAAKSAPSAESYDRKVTLLDRPHPTYPAQAMRDHEQGTVLVLAQIDVSGHVSDAQVVGRSGSFALDRAAANEVRRWKFEPALHNGQPVVASVEVPVSYRLDQ